VYKSDNGSQLFLPEAVIQIYQQNIIYFLFRLLQGCVGSYSKSVTCLGTSVSSVGICCKKNTKKSHGKVWLTEE
jgi:hypothetical protein